MKGVVSRSVSSNGEFNHSLFTHLAFRTSRNCCPCVCEIVLGMDKILPNIRTDTVTKTEPNTAMVIICGISDSH